MNLKDKFNGKNIKLGNVRANTNHSDVSTRDSLKRNFFSVSWIKCRMREQYLVDNRKRREKNLEGVEIYFSFGALTI